MGALVWITAVIGALGFAMSGAMKLVGHEMVVESLTRVGALDKRMLIGGAETAGAVGLLIGAFSSPGDGEWIGLLAALGLIVTMALAISAHRKVNDDPKESVPAAVLAVVCVLYIIALMGNS